MRAPFHHVKAGDAVEIHHREFNGMLDAGRAMLESQSGKRKESPPGPRPGLLQVRNDTGGDLSMFDVVGLGEAVFTVEDHSLEAFQDNLIFKAELPEFDDYFGKFVVLMQPIKEGQIGWAMYDGIATVKVLVPEDADDPGDDPHEAENMRFADVDGTTGHLTMRPGGTARVLSKEPGADNGEPKWAKVRLNDWSESAFIGKTDDPIAGDSGKVIVYRDLETAAGFSLTGYVESGEVAGDAWVQAKRDAYGKWWIDYEACGS